MHNLFFLDFWLLSHHHHSTDKTPFLSHKSCSVSGGSVSFLISEYSSHHTKRVSVFGLGDTEKVMREIGYCALRRKKCVSTEGIFCHVPAGISIKTCSINLTSDMFRKWRFRIISQNVFCFENGIGN